MRRIGALLLKELSQHGWVIALLAVFLGLVQGLLVLGSAVAPRTITMLETHATFMRVFLPLLGLAIGRRLVVREYYAHTQRFLESLPLRREEVFVEKLGVGAALLGLAAFASFVLASAIAALKEPVGGRWLLIVLWRTEVFALALWAFFFTMGLLGRWRIPVYLALLLVLLYLDRATEVSVARVPPLSLIGETFVLERHALPVGDLAISLAVAVGLVGLAAFLSLARDGAIADALAGTMSRREKVAIGIVLALALIATTVVEPETDEPPFAFDEPQVLRRSEALDVFYLDETHRASAEALADRLALDLEALGEAWGVEVLPTVHVALRPDLPPDEPERVELAEDDPAVLVRARFTDPSFDRARFSRFVLATVIEKATAGRAALEPIAWVRTGLAGAVAEPDAADLAAWHAARRRPRWQTLSRYRRTEERFGPDVAAAVAQVAAGVVIDHDERRWRAFARSALEPDPGPPPLAVLAIRRDPIRDRFVRETGLEVEAFERAWRGQLDALRRGVGPLPRARARATVEPEEGALRTIRWSIDFARPPEHGTFCALVHAPLGPFDDVVPDRELMREERPCDALDPEGERLRGRYTAGDRVFFAIEREGLGARLRLLAERRTLE